MFEIIALGVSAILSGGYMKKWQTDYAAKQDARDVIAALSADIIESENAVDPQIVTIAENAYRSKQRPDGYLRRKDDSIIPTGGIEKRLTGATANLWNFGATVLTVGLNRFVRSHPKIGQFIGGALFVAGSALSIASVATTIAGFIPAAIATPVFSAVASLGAATLSMSTEVRRGQIEGERDAVTRKWHLLEVCKYLQKQNEAGNLTLDGVKLSLNESNIKSVILAVNAGLNNSTIILPEAKTDPISSAQNTIRIPEEAMRSAIVTAMKSIWVKSADGNIVRKNATAAAPDLQEEKRLARHAPAEKGIRAAFTELKAQVTELQSWTQRIAGTKTTVRGH